MVNTRMLVQPAELFSAVHVSVTGPQLSLATTFVFILSQSGMKGGLQPKSSPGGHNVIVGAFVSCTVMYCVNVFVFPHVSWASQVRVICCKQDDTTLVVPL